MKNSIHSQMNLIISLGIVSLMASGCAVDPEKRIRKLNGGPEAQTSELKASSGVIGAYQIEEVRCEGLSSDKALPRLQLKGYIHFGSDRVTLKSQNQLETVSSLPAPPPAEEGTGDESNSNSEVGKIAIGPADASQIVSFAYARFESGDVALGIPDQLVLKDKKIIEESQGVDSPIVPKDVELLSGEKPSITLQGESQGENGGEILVLRTKDTDLCGEPSEKSGLLIRLSPIHQ